MSQPNALEQLMLELINEERAAAGLDPLRFNGDLNEASEDHSEWMLATDTFSHTGQGGSSAGDRIVAAGYELEGNWTWGENIAWQSERGEPGLEDDVRDLHESLMNSPGHRANILDPDFEEIGIGIERGDFGRFDSVMVTQNFGATDATPDPAPAPVPMPAPAPEPDVVVTDPPSGPSPQPPAPAPTPVPAPAPTVPASQPVPDMPDFAWSCPIDPGLPEDRPDTPAPATIWGAQPSGRPDSLADLFQDLFEFTPAAPAQPDRNPFFQGWTLPAFLQPETAPAMPDPAPAPAQSAGLEFAFDLFEGLDWGA